MKRPSVIEDRPTVRLAFSPDEAADALGVSRSFFFAQILPSLRIVRVGRRRLVPRRELERWLEDSSAQAGMRL